MLRIRSIQGLYTIFILVVDINIIYFKIKIIPSELQVNYILIRFYHRKTKCPFQFTLNKRLMEG